MNKLLLGVAVATSVLAAPASATVVLQPVYGAARVAPQPASDLPAGGPGVLLAMFGLLGIAIHSRKVARGPSAI